MLFPNMVVRHLLQLARMTSTYVSNLITRRSRYSVHTGGCSSSFSPRSGFAARLAKTPSLVGLGPPAGGVTPGNSVTLRTICGVGLPEAAPGRSTFGVSTGETGVARMSRCLSSTSSSPFSEPSPSSKASASVCSLSSSRGSSASNLLDVGDEALDRNEGGGDEGM